MESIFHPSDFSAASEFAFVHALKFALVAKARLAMLHAAADSDEDGSEFPGVRDTLERWKLIPEGSPRDAVGELGLEVRKIVMRDRDPVKACLNYLDRHPADLIVLAVGHHEGRMRWLEKSVGEPIARGAGQMTLFLPHGVEGFVSRADGSVALRNILIPVACRPHPQPAVDAAARLIANLSLPPGVVTLLHAGPANEAPGIKLPEKTAWTWNRAAAEGDPVEVILHTAAGLKSDLVMMTTEGPHGFLDGLRGSTSERVLRKASVPVAILPVGSMLG